MPFLQEPNVHMTERCWYMLKKLNLSKENVLWTFNHPDKKTRLQSAKAQYVYRYERNFADYGIGLNCFYASDTDRWIITFCWTYRR